MELRSCDNLHFITAISSNLVTKLRNVDSCGRPALVFKSLKDVIEDEDAKRLQPSASHSLWHPGLEFSLDRVKVGNHCLPPVDRRLLEIHPKENEFACHVDDDESGSDSDDHNFGTMTLKQLKEKCKMKKRKHVNSFCLNPKEVKIKLEQEEDESDLKKPLSSLKLKLPKAKRKLMTAGSKSPKAGISIKSEKNLDCEMQSPSTLRPLPIKEEILDPEFKECKRRIPVDCTTSIHCDEQNAAKPISDRNMQMVECENSKRLSFPEEYEICTLNEVSYDHLEDAEPVSLSLLSCEETIELNNQEKSYQKSLDFCLSEFETEECIMDPLQINLSTKDHNADTNDFSRSFKQTNELQSIAEKISNLTVDDCTSSKGLDHVHNSCMFENDAMGNSTSKQHICDVNSPARVCNSSWNPHPCAINDDDNHSEDDDLISIEADLTEQNEALMRGFADVTNNCFNAGNHLNSLEESTLNEEEQPPTPISIHEERNSSSENQNCNNNETPSSPPWGQPPERLLSTRKVISPTSQEQLHLAMNSAKLHDDPNRKEKLYVGEKPENKASLGSHVKHSNSAVYPNGSGTVNCGKVTISPSRIVKKLRDDRRSSLPEGNLEGPRLSRSLPTVGSGCTSLQSCSESAIAFSQRQMHDIESLAMKLMSELKSMKDIVEEKLLFEAYRNVSLKNDAEEVKTVVTNATKVEETAKKWLSMMARDCSRFCKIMSLTQKSPTSAASNDMVQRERKKITFADEAGGLLCQVKVFKDEMTSPESTSIKQENQAVGF